MQNDSPIEMRTFIFRRNKIQAELPWSVAAFIIHVMDVKMR
jgi:hypothetical protein